VDSERGWHLRFDVRCVGRKHSFGHGDNEPRRASIGCLRLGQGDSWMTECGVRTCPSRYGLKFFRIEAVVPSEGDVQVRVQAHDELQSPVQIRYGGGHL